MCSWISEEVRVYIAVLMKMFNRLAPKRDDLNNLDNLILIVEEGFRKKTGTH